MIINIKDIKKEDNKINQFFNLLEQLKESKLDLAHYYTELGNYVKVDVIDFYGKFKSKVAKIILTTDDIYSKEHYTVSCFLEENKKFEFIYILKNNITIMKDENGKITQADSWVYYPPKESVEISSSVNKTLNKMFDLFFTSDLSNLESREISEESIDKLVLTLSNTVRKSIFKVIKNDEK